jgi:hypothetical protein
MPNDKSGALSGAKARKPKAGYVICPDCDAQYKAGAPHGGFCPAKTCDECGTTVGYVLVKGAIEEGRRICNNCADRISFPEDYKDDES